MVQDFVEELSHSTDLAVAVAAIRALTNVIQRSEAQTMMGLEKDLLDASRALQKSNETSIALRAACELFMRYVTRTSTLDSDNLQGVRVHLIDRGNKFAEISSNARATITQLGGRFIRDGTTVLIHGISRVVIALLQHASNQGKRFNVVVTQASPGTAGIQCAKALEQSGINVKIVLDSSVACTMEQIDLVLVGAEAIVESGGIINKVGTYQVALVAHALGKPFYVAAESYKFARLFPLNQRDFPEEHEEIGFGATFKYANPSRDYTPPKLISMLVTDLGILTPAAVSDELIKLYH